MPGIPTEICSRSIEPVPPANLHKFENEGTSSVCPWQLAPEANKGFFTTAVDRKRDDTAAEKRDDVITTHGMQASNNEKRLLTLRRCNRPSERARSTDVGLVAFHAAPWSARQRRSHRRRIVHHISSGEHCQWHNREMLVALAQFGDHHLPNLAITLVFFRRCAIGQYRRRN